MDAVKFSSSWLPVCMDTGWGDMHIIEGEGGLGHGVAMKAGGKDGLVNVTLFWRREVFRTFVLKVVALFFHSEEKNICLVIPSFYFFILQLFVA